MSAIDSRIRAHLTLGITVFLLSISPVYADKATEIIEQTDQEIQVEKEAKIAAQKAFEYQMSRYAINRKAAAYHAGVAAGVVLAEFAHNNTFYSAAEAGRYAGETVITEGGEPKDAFTAAFDTTIVAEGDANGCCLRSVQRG